MIKNLIVGIASIFLSFNVFALDDAHEYYSERQGDMVLMLVGTGEAYEKKVPGIKEKAVCFDLDLIDMANNSVIGKGVDCLSDIQIDEDTGNINIIGTTIFKLPQGKLFTQGPLSLRPVDIPMATSYGMTVTHITGAGREGNTIVKGTKKYANAEANVRLSGMVDMSNFAGIGTPVKFSCIFVISEIDLN